MRKLKIKPVNLKLAAVLFGADRNAQEQIWRGHTHGLNDAVIYTRSSKTGYTDGANEKEDCEQIKMNLGRIAQRTAYIFFVAQSVKGTPFSSIKGVSGQIRSGDDQACIHECDIASESQNSRKMEKLMVFGGLNRSGEKWSLVTDLNVFAEWLPTLQCMDFAR